MAHARALLLILAGACACTDSAGADADAGPVEPGELDGACPLNERVGLFSVTLEPDYSVVDGEILDAVIPATIQALVLEQGGCRVLARQNPFCDPACTAGETCSQDGACVPYPARRETGTVSVAGLDVPVAMTPRADKRYFETQLPHPAFTPGGAISLSSTGGEVGPLELSGRRIEALELDAEVWQLSAGAALEIGWVPGQDADASVYLTLNIDQHGASPSTLECEGPDSGSFEIPAAIIDALLDAGTSGFPTGQAYRRTVDSSEAETGCVEFQVRSHRSVEVEVTGHTPCVSEADCPDGLSCDTLNQTCV